MSHAFLIILAFSFSLFSQVVITEIARNPMGGETSMPGGASHEFVEFTNFGMDTLHTDSLCLSDGVEADTVVPWPSPLSIHPDCSTNCKIVLPGQTALILDRDYPTAVDKVPSSRYPIRAGTVLLTVGDAELGNGLAEDDGILLYKGNKMRVDRILWCAADSAFIGTSPTPGKITLAEPRHVPEGFSVVPVSFLFDTVRYAICADSLTPGSFELLSNRWFTEWKFGALDSTHAIFACTLACIKSGLRPIAPIRWSVIKKSATTTVTVGQGNCTLTENRSGAAFSLPLDSLSFFLHLIEQGAETVWPLDISKLWTPASPVRINEIFPRATAGEPEWVELVNGSAMAINLKNWTFGNSESFDTITVSDLLLRPGEFLLLAANGALFSQRYPARNRVVVPPHWHALDNYNDTLCLWDAKHCRKELVCWRSDWFTEWKYQSLERVSIAASGTDASSWSLASSPTPGQPNGAMFWRAVPQPRLDAGPLPFSPNNDGRDDLLSIFVELPAGYSATIAIYGFSGKKLRTFTGPPAPKLYWDGKLDNGSPAPVGPFFVVMEATSQNGTTVTLRKKGVLWR